MQALFIYIDKDKKFDPEKLKRDLQTIDGVSNINGKGLKDSIVACDYEFEGYPVIVRLSDDLTTITADSNSETSWHLALELQQREKRPLRIFNDNYDFHFSVSGVDSLTELKQKINEDYFDEEALALENQVEEVQAA